jgi:hypothetical protein
VIGSPFRCQIDKTPARQRCVGKRGLHSPPLVVPECLADMILPAALCLVGLR